MLLAFSCRLSSVVCCFSLYFRSQLVWVYLFLVFLGVVFIPCLVLLFLAVIFISCCWLIFLAVAFIPCLVLLLLFFFLAVVLNSHRQFSSHSLISIKIWSKFKILLLVRSRSANASFIRCFNGACGLFWSGNLASKDDCLRRKEEEEVWEWVFLGRGWVGMGLKFGWFTGWTWRVSVG